MTKSRPSPRRELFASANGEPVHVIVHRPPFPWRNVLIGLGVGAGLYAATWLYERLHQVFIMLVVAGLIALVLDPLVQALQRRMRRWHAVVVVYLGFVALLSIGGLIVIPRIVGQLQQLQESAPRIERSIHEYTDQVNTYIERVPPQAAEQLHKVQTSLNEWTNAMLRTFFTVLVAGLGWAGKGMIILVLSIYILLDKDGLREGLLSVVPVPARAETVSVLGDALKVLRAYLRGQIVVIGFVAVAVTIALWLADMPYALTIGVLAGILEVIPYFGAVVGAIPGVLYTFAVHGPGWGLAMVGFFVIINQLEGHVVIPLVMGANLEMRPFVVLLSLLVGAELGGIVGLIVAVPVCRILQVFIEHAIQIYRDLRGIAAVESEIAAEAAQPLSALEREALTD